MNDLATISNTTPFCPHCRTPLSKSGHYFRKNDRAIVQRYCCKTCRKWFSDSYFSSCYKQKKRHMNLLVFKLLAAGYSQRRLAFDFPLNRKTVVRKFIFLGLEAQKRLAIWNRRQAPAHAMQFDDLETLEHSKYKPVSITLAVEEDTRRILGFRVASMPCKGILSKRAKQKYGRRPDERRQARKALFQELQDLVSSKAIIRSDQNPHYPEDVRHFFPDAEHQVFKGRRGCVIGQGELKRGGHDPLFSLNHTCAMLRANINRLFRRTWCTTKKRERLNLHIALYALNHNLRLI